MVYNSEERVALEKRLKNIILFPGPLSEYEKFVGYPVEIIDTKKNDKGVYYNDTYFPPIVGDMEFALYLANQQIEALVNVQYVGSSTTEKSKKYGLPVRKSSLVNKL